VFLFPRLGFVEALNSLTIKKAAHADGFADFSLFQAVVAAG